MTSFFDMASRGRSKQWEARYGAVGLCHVGCFIYTSSSVHTGVPSSKAFTRIDVMQKQF